MYRIRWSGSGSRGGVAQREHLGGCVALFAQRADGEGVVALGEANSVALAQQRSVEVGERRQVSARCRRIWRAVDLSRSAPRTTSVMCM